jgi:hypothetical protein
LQSALRSIAKRENFAPYCAHSDTGEMADHVERSVISASCVPNGIRQYYHANFKLNAD